MVDSGFLCSVGVYAQFFLVLTSHLLILHSVRIIYFIGVNIVAIMLLSYLKTMYNVIYS